MKMFPRNMARSKTPPTQNIPQISGELQTDIYLSVSQHPVTRSPYIPLLTSPAASSTDTTVLVYNTKSTHYHPSTTQIYAGK